MDTRDLINKIAADSAQPRLRLRNAWWVAAGCAVVLAMATFFVTLGPRPDLASAVETLRFLLKFVFALAIVVTAFAVLTALSRPTGTPDIRWLLVAPVMLAVAVVTELFVLPRGLWEERLVGSNNMKCLMFIPLIAIGPLVVLLMALRHGAPTRLRLAGAVAGFLAGGIAATFYAAHCPDDSPLFVGVWYTIAIVILTLTGALVAPKMARW